jgi:large subunit ribosomal protein L15
MDLTTVSTGVSKRILKKRVGRGIGSGHGKTGTRGHKGQYASAGAEMAGVLFAGGQTPIHRRFPKRGFSNATFAKDFAIVNVGDLNKFDDGAAVDTASLAERRIVNGTYDGLRVLGEGELTKKLTVTCDHASAGVKAKIEAAGGTVVLVPKPKKPVRNKMGTQAKLLTAKHGGKPKPAKAPKA